MSMDAGGLAQMSYSNFPSSIGIPGSGFASRGKGAHIKRLSFEPSLPAGSQGNGAPTPRTSRSHLLAGLRTAPKSASTPHYPPPSAPANMQHRAGGLDSSIYADSKDNARAYGGPKTSIGSSFSTQPLAYNPSRQMYSVPEQPLAPPEIQLDEHGQEQMDPNLYAQLVATNMYLAEQQQRLQQQLINVQAAAQQFQGMTLSPMGMPQPFTTPPITPNGGLYQQQMKQNMQPIVTPVAAQPGVYSVYNPMTGQQSFFVDQNAQPVYGDNQPTAISYREHSPPQQPGTPRFQVSPPTNGTPLRSISPPKKSTSPPQDHTPLPPPSANAFRRGHKKASSLANVISAASAPTAEGTPRIGVPKSAGFPLTPSTATFGPGQARAGEHPIRQPRGPPSLDELVAKPTTKFEGSKNFATRQRRSAVHNLVRAGMERRRSPGSGSGSAGSITPISEHGSITFSISDHDSDSGSGSGSLSGKPSLGNLRTSAHGAIGSDRPSSRQKERSQERNSVGSASSLSSDEETSATGSFAAVFKNGAKKADGEPERRKAPMLVLSSAEKRQSSLF